MYLFVKSQLNKLRHNDLVMRVVHTTYQAGIPVLISQLVLVKSSADLKGAFIVSGAAVLAALKALVVSQLKG